jgi:hypothetical protein
MRSFIGYAIGGGDSYFNGGELGIGTTTPNFQLEVVRGTAGVVARFTDSDGSCDIDPTSTALVCASDQNLKKDISTLQGTLAKLQNFRGVNFRWKTQDDSALRIGFIAQEVESVFPELVKTDIITGIKSVNYLGFAPVLVNAIKEQQTEIETIQNQLSALQGSDAISGNTPIVIKSHLYLSKDSVGQAKILAGATSVRVSFEKPYEYQPIVTATPNSRLVVVDVHHAEAGRLLARHLDARDRRVGAAQHVAPQHLAVVHLVDVVAGHDQDVFRVVAAEEVHVLEYRVGGALVPIFADLLLRRQDVDELVKAPVEEAPAALQVLDQALRLRYQEHHWTQLYLCVHLLPVVCVILHLQLFRTI